MNETTFGSTDTATAENYGSTSGTFAPTDSTDVVSGSVVSTSTSADPMVATVASTPENADLVVPPHVHGPGCGHPKTKKNKERQPTMEDFNRGSKHLLHSGYDKIKDRFNTAYVMENRKNGIIVEIRAASAMHACTMIGWRPRHTRVVEVKDLSKKEVQDGQQ